MDLILGSTEEPEFLNAKKKVGAYKAYRDLLSALRRRINIVERLMSENRWNEIEFDKIPSKAGLIYKNAFAKQDADRYKEFMASKETKVNAGTNYPYEMVREVTKHLNHCYWEDDYEWTEEERNAIKRDAKDARKMEILKMKILLGKLLKNYLL